MFGVKRRPGGARFALAWTAALDDHVAALDWHADGTLAAASVAGPVALFAGADGEQVARLPGHQLGTLAARWQPQGTLLATGGQDGSTRLWNRAGTQVAELDAGAPWVECLAWNAAGAVLASGAGKRVRFWNPAGELLREAADHASTISDLQWHPVMHEVAAACYGGVQLRSPTEGAVEQHFPYQGSVLRLAWSPNGKYLASGNQDATVNFWQRTTGDMLQMWGFPAKVRELSWGFAGKYLATGGGETVCVWDCSGKGPRGRKPQLLQGHDDLLSCLAFQHRGTWLASGAADGRVLLWQPGGEPEQSLADAAPADWNGGPVATLAWSRDDEWLAVGGSGGALAVYGVT